MRWRAAIRKAARMLTPWPHRHERRAAIEAARSEKARSLQGAEQAAAIGRDIRRMAAQNHFAAAIADQIVARHRGGG